MLEIDVPRGYEGVLGDPMPNPVAKITCLAKMCASPDSIALGGGYIHLLVAGSLSIDVMFDDIHTFNSKLSAECSSQLESC